MKCQAEGGMLSQTKVSIQTCTGKIEFIFSF